MESVIIAVGLLTNGYLVTFRREDGWVYSEQWTTIPEGWEDRVNRY